MDNAQRFLNAFAMIEKQLKQITGVTRYSRFYQLLNQASRSSGLVRKYEMELQEYADLRNAIVHQRSDEGHIIASTRSLRKLRSWRGKSANRRESAHIFSSR